MRPWLSPTKHGSHNMRPLQCRWRIFGIHTPKCAIEAFSTAPCQEGKKKQNPLNPARTHRLFIPPDKGLLKRPEERGITPPLRVWLPEGKARRGSRAVCAKAESVGGKMRFIASPNYTPHRIAFGLTPSALRLPLKGGVKFKNLRSIKIAPRDFFNRPDKGGRGGCFPRGKSGVRAEAAFPLKAMSPNGGFFNNSRWARPGRFPLTTHHPVSNIGKRSKPTTYPTRNPDAGKSYRRF